MFFSIKLLSVPYREYDVSIVIFNTEFIKWAIKTPLLVW